MIKSNHNVEDIKIAFNNYIISSPCYLHMDLCRERSKLKQEKLNNPSKDQNTTITTGKLKESATGARRNGLKNSV